MLLAAFLVTLARILTLCCPFGVRRTSKKKKVLFAATTPERFEHISYATGLKPDNYVAIYKHKRSLLKFAALTAGISWQLYLLLLLSFAFFVVTHQAIERALLHKQRVQKIRSNLITNKSFSANPPGESCALVYRARI